MPERFHFSKSKFSQISIAQARWQLVSSRVSFSRLAQYWLPVLIWMSLIFAASTDLMSTQHTSRFIKPFLRWLKPDISDEAIHTIQFGVRKCAHATEYGILSLLLWRARRQVAFNPGRPWLWMDALFAILISAVYAASDEIHQSFVKSRQSSVWDVLIDTAGAIAAVLFLKVISRSRRSEQK